MVLDSLSAVFGRGIYCSSSSKVTSPHFDDVTQEITEGIPLNEGDNDRHHQKSFFSIVMKNSILEGRSVNQKLF